jgi:hypothetical protein
MYKFIFVAERHLVLGTWYLFLLILVHLKGEVKMFAPESKQFLVQIKLGGNSRAMKVVMVTDAW